MKRKHRTTLGKARRIVRNGQKVARTAMRAQDVAVLVGVPVTGLVGYATMAASNLPAEVTQNVAQFGLVAMAVALGIVLLK